MMLSPQDKQTVLEMAARNVAEQVCGAIDIAELITLPLAVVSQITGMGARQVERVLPIRALGARRRGVSLKAVQQYQQQQP